MRSMTAVIFILLLCAACGSTKTEVTVMDFRKAQGAWILAYTTDPEIRTLMEDRLVADLAERGIKAYPSYPDLPDIRKSNRDSVLGAATARRAMFIIVVDEVRPGARGAVRDPGRITHEHPTLQDFYRHTRNLEPNYDPDREVFVEVSAFLIQQDYAKLVWSGTTWSFQADGKGGQIAAMSATIANQIARARRQYLSR